MKGKPITISRLETWIVTVTREHFGAGEKTVYLVRTYTEIGALAIAKRESGYTSMLAGDSKQPTGIWTFDVRELPDADITEISSFGWGGW